MGKRILITGAAGFVGRNLVRHLAADESNHIVGIDLLPAFEPVDDRPLNNFRYQCGNLWQKELIQEVMAGDRFDAIVHLAAILSQRDDFETLYSRIDSNLKASFLVLEVAKAHGARVIFPSTALVYGDQKGPFTETMEAKPADFYSFSKHLCEKVILFYRERFGIRSVIFRPAILYGEGQSNTMFIPGLLNSLLEGKEFPMTPGEQNRDFLHVADFANAVSLVLANNDLSGVYNIGTNHRWQLLDVAKMGEKVVGVQNKIRPGAIKYRDNEAWDYCVSYEKLKGDTGWVPRISLEEGLQRAAEYYRKKIGTK